MGRGRSWRRDQKAKLSCDAVSIGPYLTPDSFEAWMTLNSCPHLWPGDQAFILFHLSAIARWPPQEGGVALSRRLPAALSPPGSREWKASFSSTAAETVFCPDSGRPSVHPGKLRKRTESLAKRGVTCHGCLRPDTQGQVHPWWGAFGFLSLQFFALTRFFSLAACGSHTSLLFGC